MVIAQLQGAAWWQGTAVWWLMARPDSRLVDLTGLSRMGLAFEYLVNFFTHAIVLYELCFVFLIWNPLARPILLVVGAFVWRACASGWICQLRRPHVCGDAGIYFATDIAKLLLR